MVILVVFTGFSLFLHSKPSRLPRQNSFPSAAMSSFPFIPIRRVHLPAQERKKKQPARAGYAILPINRNKKNVKVEKENYKRSKKRT